MGFFDKLKSIITKKEKKVEEVEVEKVTSSEDIEEVEEINKYDKGLEKTRKEFVSKLSLLGVKYTKIDEEYFEN